MKVILNNTQECWVTSDQHFGHANILKWVERPYETVQEMDAGLIDHWNANVQPGDIVFHLGDFTLSGIDVARSVFSRLNGIIYVLGNEDHHDRHWLKDANLGISCKQGNSVHILQPMVTLLFPQLGNEWPLAVALCHFPFMVWDRKHHGSYHFHGHIHGDHDPDDLPPTDPQPEPKRLNVGADSWNGYPLNVKEAISICDNPRGIGRATEAVEQGV